MQTAPEAAPEKEKKAKEKTVGGEILSWVVSLAVALAVAMLIRTFLFTLITVDGRSMTDTLLDRDRLYVSVLSAKLQGYDHGDVVICHFPGRNDLCVKRVIAMPGDTVMIDHGQVYLNGEALEEDYVVYRGSYSYPETTMKEGEYFLLGDNRQVSHDSHSPDVGPVTRIVGKARAIIWPLSRISGIE